MKLTTALTAAVLSLALCVPVARASSDTTPGPVFNGITLNGFTLNGLTLNGFSLNGFTLNGWSLNGFTVNGFNFNGFTVNGTTLNGPVLQGLTLNGIQFNGPGLVLQGTSPQGGLFADAARSPLSGIALDNVHVTLPKH